MREIDYRDHRLTQDASNPGGDWPEWLSDGYKQYLRHVVLGHAIRRISREDGVAASTVTRRIRQIESKRDDPLVDEALSLLSAACVPLSHGTQYQERSMNASVRPPILSDEPTIKREARRILRRLCETSAVLVLAKDMDKAVVLRAGADGRQTRTAVVDRNVALSFALKDWIEPDQVGRLATYRITAAGRAALKRLIEEDRKKRADQDLAFAEVQTPFQAQHAIWGQREIVDDDGRRTSRRVNLAETPLTVLARRKGPDGAPFLSNDLIEAGEQLREDFERAQMGPRIAQNWERFLTGADRGGFLSDSGLAEGPRAARQRVSDALDDLGPGLADVVLRVCCFLEGLESTEKRLGWSARSGKIVLKIGLQRLAVYYRQKAR